MSYYGCFFSFFFLSRGKLLAGQILLQAARSMESTSSVDLEGTGSTVRAFECRCLFIEWGTLNEPGHFERRPGQTAASPTDLPWEYIGCYCFHVVLSAFQIIVVAPVRNHCIAAMLVIYFLPPLFSAASTHCYKVSLTESVHCLGLHYLYVCICIICVSRMMHWRQIVMLLCGVAVSLREAKTRNWPHTWTVRGRR